MAVELPPEESNRFWQQWLIDRNRRGARAVLWIDLILYPTFAILDYLVAPAEWLWLLWASRAIVTALTVAGFFVLRGSLFDRHWPMLTAFHIAASGLGISVMVAVMGGFSSPYYAGINLVMIGAGLLYVWPRNTVLATQTIIMLSYVVPGVVIANEHELLVGVSNLFFLVSTAIIVSAGQIFQYRAQHTQVVTQLTLERTKATLEHAHEQLKQLDRFKSQFFANITHELKTPLAMILSPLELMIGGDMGRVGEEQAASLSSMFRNGMKLLKLIQDLLDLSKLEESRIRLKIAEHDVTEYLRSLVGQTQPLTQRKNIEMTFTASAPLSLVWCDLDRLERVFINLLSNAAKFTAPGGHIRVEMEDQESTVHITVADDGPGFPADKADKVFERFYQVDMGGTRKYGGTGIGLALAKELVELHGGRIWAESDVGKGATFHVLLVKDRDHFRPDALDRRGERKAVPDGKRTVDRSISDWSVQLAAREDYRFLDIAEVTERRIVERDLDEQSRQYTVLVVDDTPDVIRIVHLALRQQFKVLAAEDGVKALDLATREPPNLIVTDFMMPNMDGMELTKRLREDPRTRHIPIIMLTARGDLEDKIAGLETGVNAYLAKPFSPKELLTTARSLLNIQERQADILLTQRMDSLERVASGLAHEINNPLNYIKNAVEVIRTESVKLVDLVKASAGREYTEVEAARVKKLEGRVQKMYETAEAGVKRIAGTVDLMRKYSREGYTRALLPHDLFVAGRQVVDIVLPATGRDVAVTTSFEGDGTVECVPEELNQVLTNLIQNAIEAVPEGAGRVEVIGSATDDAVVLLVRDNGPGIPPEVREQIFTPFFTTKGPGKGMGLGLTITWRVVKGHGGTLEVRSQVGQGTEFEVRLPRRRPAADGGIVPAA